MSVKPMNLVFIMSDEHNRDMLGCYGHPVVRTPNLDRLSENGVRFNNAYCNSPICVPSRGSLATGRYVHEIGTWDNSAPYIGNYPSWGHRLTEQGYDVTTIGKLHYRNDQDDTGFPDKRVSMHIKDGIGDIFSLVRGEKAGTRPNSHQKILEAGPGETDYVRYDRNVTTEAQRYFNEKAEVNGKPWAVFISYLCPHFPLIAPQEYYDMYPLDNVLLPKQYSLSERPMHPVIEESRRIFNYQNEFDEHTIRKAVAAYYGLCTFLDDQVGEVLQALKANGLDENTRIIYASDHGDTLGDHGCWFKSTMYEGSVGIPFIMSGPDLPKGKVVEENVSLVDCFPTIVEAIGAKLTNEDNDLPGMSLFSLAKDGLKINRTIFSEYHAAGAVTGMFMIRNEQYKFVYYPEYRPQLFDLNKDPDELNDLAEDPNYQEILNACELELRKILDPEAVDQAAKADQMMRVEIHGGVEAVLRKGHNIPYSPPPKEYS